MAGASLVAQMVKNLPAMQENPVMCETWVQPLDWEDSLEEGMATHSSILVWRIPWTEEPSRLQSMELQRVRHDWAINTYTSLLSMASFKILDWFPAATHVWAASVLLFVSVQAGKTNNTR